MKNTKMMTRYTIRIRQAGFIFLSVTIILITACRLGPEAPERDFAIMDLLLKASDLPYGWREECLPEPPLQVDGEIISSDSISVTFRAPGVSRELVNHRVYRFRYINTALKEYNEECETWHYNPAFAPPKVLPFKSDYAEASVFVCGSERVGRKHCHFMGAYREFLVTINIIMRGNLRFDDIKRILEKTDRTMAAYLYQPKSK